jgi:GAF domain-containing protein
MRPIDTRPSSQKTAQAETRVRTLLLFGVVGSLVVALVEVVYFILSRTAPVGQFNALLVINTFMGLALLANTLFLARSKNLALAAWSFIAITNGAFLAAQFFVSQLGIIFAVGAFLFTMIFALQALPRRSLPIATLVGVLVSVFIVLVEYGLDLPNLIVANVRLQQMLIIAIGSVVIFTGVYVINQAEFRSVRARLNATFLVAIIVPILMTGVPPILNTQALLSEKAIQNLGFTAGQAGNSVDIFIQENLDLIRTAVSLPNLAGYLQEEVEEQEALSTLQALASARGDIRSVLLLNANGIVLNETDPTQNKVGRDLSANPYYLNALSSLRPSLSDVLFDAATGEARLYFSAPMQDSGGNFIGMLIFEYDASILQHRLENQIEGSTSQVLLLDENHTILAHTLDGALLYKTTMPLSAEELADLQATLRLPPGTREELTLDLPNLEDSLAADLPNFLVELEENNNSYDQAVQVAMTSKPWIVVALEPGEVFLQPLYDQLRRSIFTILVVIVGAGAVAALTSNILVSPLKQITATAERIRTGELLSRTGVERADEFGILASVMDQTTEQLSTTLKDLEQRIAERTYDLEISRLQSEERSRNLEVISEVSRAISAEQRLEILLPLITQTVSEKFDFYHVGIFLLDPTRTYAVLQAANSAGGQRMLARGHRLEVGQTGIVGYVAQTGRARIALDVGADSSYFNNPDLPETHSEIALPLLVRGQVIGVLDVQSARQGAFTNNDANSLSILADQVAIAIENARLFERTQQALAEAQATYSQYVRQEWRTFAQQAKKVGYYQSASGGTLLEKPVFTAEIQEALEQGTVVALDGSPDRQPTVVVPVKLRDEILGVLNVVSLQRDRRWSQDEISLIQTASDRLALALENARLLEDSLRRAERERRVSDITARIRSTNDPNEMIRMAVQELKHALGVSRVDVLPQTVSVKPGHSEANP